MEKQVSKGWLKAFKDLNESQQRWFAGLKAIDLGYGGVSTLSRATGLSRNTISRGAKEVKSSKKLSSSGGRKSIVEDSNQKKLVDDFQRILDETTAGDPFNS